MIDARPSGPVILSPDERHGGDARCGRPGAQRVLAGVPEVLRAAGVMLLHA
jgi:hypothetical protein